MRRRDLIISEDPQMAAALEQFDRGDRSGVDKLLKQGVLNRRSSLDLMEQLRCLLGRLQLRSKRL